MMAENKKLNKNEEIKVAGGVTIEGMQKTLLEESEVKKYEYKCNSCGKLSYRDSESSFQSCPYCGAYFGYSATGEVLFDYDYVNGANWRSVQGQDT